MKPILIFFPGAGPPGKVAESLSRLFPDFEVAGITYPAWRDLTCPEQAMDHVLERAELQLGAVTNRAPVLILGYSLGAQIGWGFAHRLQRSGGQVAFFGAINGRVVAADKPDRDWASRAIRQFSTHLSRGDLRAVGTFINSRLSRLLQRAAGRDLSKMAVKWARRGRVPWLLARNPAFETELSMRLLIQAAVPWTAEIETRLPPLVCPALLVRGPEDEAFDARWRALCPRIDIKPVTSSHLAVLGESQLHEVVELVKASARKQSELWQAPPPAASRSDTLADWPAAVSTPSGPSVTH